MTTEDDDSIPDEPDELALWRDIAEYRDGLVRRIKAAETAQEFGARARAGAERGITGRLEGGERLEDYAERIERIGRNAEEAVRRNAKGAEVKLRQLDSSLRAREGKEKKHKIASARKIRDQLLEPAVTAARRSVLDYLAESHFEDGAEAALRIAALTGVQSLDLLPDIDALISDVRRARSENNSDHRASGTRAAQAMRVVNKAIGRSPESGRRGTKRGR